MTATRADANTWYAAWFIARADSSVALAVARSADDGSTWASPVIADARDRGRRGCRRPPPALHADTTNGYVHVAYFIEPGDGAGIWYSHSMERGAVWHQTIGVIYGRRPAAVGVVSAGDVVLVAYEHPGARGTRLGIAISRRTGHTFAERLRVVRASGLAADPRVAVRGKTVALAWTERTGTATSSEKGRTRARTGALR